LLLAAASLSVLGLQNAAGDPLLTPAIAVAPGSTVPSGTELALDASGSSHSLDAGDVAQIQYRWDLGDGTRSTGPQLNHVYGAPGDYRVQLTMELTRTDGEVYRGAAAHRITITPGAAPELIAIIDLETGERRPGPFAALVRLEDELLLLQVSAGRIDTAPVVETADPSWIDALDRYAMMGGLIAVEGLRLWTGSLAYDLEIEPLFASVTLGLSTETASLDRWVADASIGDREITAVIDHADLISVGIGYRLSEGLYALGSLGSLRTAGRFEGSPRITLDGEPLPSPFDHRTIVLCLGIGVRLSWVILSVGAMVPL
jgi:hypothetical protein